MQKQKFKGIITLLDLKECFKYHAIEGKYLNKDRFNETIQKLLSKFDIPFIHHTYVSEKIYDVLDDSADGKIQEDEFVNGMKNVLTSKEFRLKSKSIF